MTALWCVAVIGVLAAWLPVETRPGAAVLLSAGFLILLPWAWSRTRSENATKAAVAVVVWVVFLTLGLSGGWDRSHGFGEVALAGGVLGLIWLASRERPSAVQISVWAVGIAALSLWGLAQSWGGLEQIRPAVDQLPDHLKLGALARIDQGRAFASLYLPGHLAVLLATVLPILVARIARDAFGLACAAAAVMATLGLVGHKVANRRIPGRRRMHHRRRQQAFEGRSRVVDRPDRRDCVRDGAAPRRARSRTPAFARRQLERGALDVARGAFRKRRVWWFRPGLTSGPLGARELPGPRPFPSYGVARRFRRCRACRLDRADDVVAQGRTVAVAFTPGACCGAAGRSNAQHAGLFPLHIRSRFAVGGVGGLVCRSRIPERSLRTERPHPCESSRSSSRPAL